MPKRELSQLQLLPRHLLQLNELLTQYVPGAEVWAYGSRVSGGAHEGSDLDLVLRRSSDTATAEFDRLGLLNALRESTLPLLVDVQNWEHLPEAFHQEIRHDYVVIRVPDRKSA